MSVVNSKLFSWKMNEIKDSKKKLDPMDFELKEYNEVQTTLS